MAGPIATAKAAVAALSSEVETFRQDCARILQQDDAGTANPETRALCRSCVRFQTTTSNLLAQVESLRAEDEPKKMADFSQQKKQQLRRVQGIQARLSNLASQLEPADDDNILGGDGELSAESSEVDLPPSPQDPTLSGDGPLKEVASEDQSASGEDGSGSEYELPQAVALANYSGQQEGDLDIQEGEVLYIVDNTREDGWWLAENESGVSGLVPGNYFELIESDSAPESATPSPRLSSRRAQEVVGTYETEEDENDEDSGDNKERESFSRPSVDSALQSLRGPTPLRGEPAQDASELHRQADPNDIERPSSFQRWQLLRTAVVQPTVTDVLRSMGAMPSGFRKSTLAELANKSQHTCYHCLQPRVDDTGLLFDGLNWDESTGSIQPQHVGVMRGVTVLSCRKIPLLGDNFVVMRRQARVTLFDKETVLCNIQSATAGPGEKDFKSWGFAKIPGKSVADSSFVVRAEKLFPALCILFELGMTCRNSKSGDVVELSCGWATLDLTSITGTAVVNKVHELKLNGGTPYESGVELDAQVAISKRFSSLKSSLRQGTAGPSLSVRVVTLTQDLVQTANDLPKLIVARTCHLQVLSLYRQLQAVDLVASRPFQAGNAICDVVHTSFQKVVDDCDLMDVLTVKLAEAIKEYKRDHKQRTPGYKRFLLRDVIKTHLYILLATSGLPAADDSSLERERDRQHYIEHFMRQPDPVASLFTSTAHQKPFHTDETAYCIGRMASQTDEERAQG